MKELLATLPQIGKVEQISIRPVKRELPEIRQSVQVSPEEGLHGDHYQGRSQKRQVTLIQAEHLEAVASMLGVEEIDPLLTRRNIVVSGLNLLALKGKQFQIGSAILETTGPCEPCSRMEKNFGPGGYNAMRGHGGICAKVIEAGVIKVGDLVSAIESSPI